MKTKLLSWSLLLTIFLLHGCAKNPVTGKRDFMLMSESQEKALGAQSDPQIIATMGLYEDPTLQKFIKEKGQQMAAVSHRKDLKYEFKIVDSPVVNAFAVPGGYVYFTRGIMAHFNNEAEFAGVLGHEIGHITARHSAKQYSNAMLGQIGLIAGSVLSPTFAQYAELAGQGMQLLFLKFGRDAESQSDKLGVEYSTKIGYDAEEMAGFFSTLDRLSADAGQEIPTFLSTHPDPADREKKVARLANEWDRKTDKDLSVNRDSYLRMIDGIIYGEDPKQGFVENNMFFHPVMKFQFPIPAQWQVQNTPQQVQIVEPQGQAFMLLTLAEGNDLEAAAESLLQKYQLSPAQSGRETVNGLNAIAIIADQNAQQGQQQQASVRTLIYLIQYGGNIYAMIGASAKQNFDTYARTFQNTMRSFNELTDQEKITRQPELVRIKTIDNATTLQSALTRFQMPQDRHEEIAVLNGMRLNDRLEAGTLIKVIERGTPLTVKR
ncbi:MAG TPA: M48 family metalloprotease [Chryseosolibacter sp.]|nr:M48 family metalloprotease [Chryseosolibacter sp.]